MKKIAFCLLATTILLVSCGGESVKEKEAEITVEDMNPNDDGGFILPQPITLASALKNAGLVYQKGKTHDANKKNAYSLKIDQLLVLGVYSTDLAYCAINNKTQEAREYLSAMQTLGDKVGLSAVFSDKDLIARFDKNLGNAEGLEELIYELQEKSDVYMEDNDLKSIAAVQFTGSWAEGMYLGIEDARKKGDIGVALVEQMTLLKNIIIALETNPSKEDARLKEITGLVKNIQTVYKGFSSVVEADKNVNFKAPKLTEVEFEKLATEVIKLRSNIINGK